MDANSYFASLDKDIQQFQDISVEEMRRDQSGKTTVTENLKCMIEQVEKLKKILLVLDIEKNDPDYGIKHQLTTMQINTLKYIAEHFVERVHLLEHMLCIEN